jgi:YD repeat-containing protein
VTYTANGRTASVTDGRGQVSTMTYDGFDRLSRLCYPTVSAACATATQAYEAYGYDAASNVVSRRTRSGDSFTTVYDALNRPTITYAPAGDPPTWGYDNLNRVLTVTDGSHTDSYTWDALGRQTSATGPLGTVSSAYDAAGRRTRLTWPDGTFADYGYSVTGELGGISLTAASATVLVWGQVMDDLGRPATTYRAITSTRATATMASRGCRP